MTATKSFFWINRKKLTNLAHQRFKVPALQPNLARKSIWQRWTFFWVLHFLKEICRYNNMIVLLHCSIKQEVPLYLKDIDKTLHIKGQMIYIPEWDQMLFLACPIMKDLNSLIWCGLFVNDLRLASLCPTRLEAFGNPIRTCWVISPSILKTLFFIVCMIILEISCWRHPRKWLRWEWPCQPRKPKLMLLIVNSESSMRS